MPLGRQPVASVAQRHVRLWLENRIISQRKRTVFPAGNLIFFVCHNLLRC